MAAAKQEIHVVHSSHLDLYWIGPQPECLEIGARIINDAVNMAKENRSFTFLLDTVRFLEYYLSKFPDQKQSLKQLFDNGQFEIAACYTDRMENLHDGESMVRNVLYGKKVLHRLLGIDTELAYHPDLPGLAEQTPQIYKKSGVNYYLFARGFVRGGRFWWKGLDDSKMIAYNFPVHYSYYNVEKEVIPHLDETKRAIRSEDVLLSWSAGDLGDADTFVTKSEDGKWGRVSVTEMMRDLNRKYPDLNFHMSNVKTVLDRMNNDGLEVRSGEYPSKWGSFGGTSCNVDIAQMDQQVSALLLEAEKYAAICDLLGMPAEWGSEPVNPLKHKGGSGGSRNYFELKQNPADVMEWIEYAWRAQLVTQDHNYGGIGGMQSNFDRLLYKTAAKNIADRIRNMCLEKIAARIDSKPGSIVIFNSLNWHRTETVNVQADQLDQGKSYVVKDSDGNTAPLIRTEEGYSFIADGVPPMGYKTYTFEQAENSPAVLGSKHTKVGKKQIKVKNKYYEIAVDRVNGTLTYVKDVQLNKVIIDNPDFLSVDLSEDKSFSVSEKIFDKVSLESTKQNVRSAEVTEDHEFWTKIEIVSEICDAKIVTDIYLDHTKKEIRIAPKLFWIGEGEVQLNLNLGFRPEFSKVHYAVPYGVQEMGKFLDHEKPWAGDEISPELYERYRDVQGWFVMENDGMGICLSGNHSSYDFDHGSLRALLLRIVRSGGDQDVMFLNAGKLSWEFTISTYSGGWENNRVYRTHWQQQYPLRVTGKPAAASKQDFPAKRSFVDAGEEGVLTVFKKSEKSPEAYVLRLFNSTSKAEPFAVATELPVSGFACCDFNESAVADAMDRLNPYEIKTIRMTRQ